MSRSRLLLIALLSAGATHGCGEDTAAPQVPARLVFTLAPGSTVAGAFLAPAIQVTIQDAAGQTVTTATTTVSLTLRNPPGADGALLGTSMQAAVGGVATFADLHIDRIGSGYVLAASAPGLAGTDSGPFDIAHGAATRLAYLSVAQAATAGETIAPAIRVVIFDALGNTATTVSSAVTVALHDNPAGGMLSGTTTVSAVNGVATFATLAIDKAGTGYTLRATAGGLDEAISPAISVRASLVFSTVTAGGAGQGSHTCGIADGAVYCWGYNGNGQLGDDTSVDKLNPSQVQTPAGVQFQSVSAGGQHTCAVTLTGDVYCWGRNEFGRLGDGTTDDRRLPVRVAAPAGVTFVSVSPAAGHSCALATGGVAYCWGSGFSGELGYGGNAERHVPVPVQAPAGVTFTAVTTGFFFGCGLATDGDVYCWGVNGAGQLGDNTTTSRFTPVRVMAPAGVSFDRVEAGYAHACALTAAGAAYCWGANDNGQLGDGTGISRAVPTAVQGNHAFALLSGGGSHTCGVTVGGAGYCWGRNTSGEIGDNSLANRLAPSAVTGSLTLSIPAAGLSHSCALTTGPNARLYCWGDNRKGQLGDGTTTMQLAPVRVR